MSKSISDVHAEIGGMKFTLRVSNEALVALEAATNKSYAEVFNSLGGDAPRYGEVTDAFACFALPHGKHTGRSIRNVVSPVEGLKIAREKVIEAIVAGMPEIKARIEGDTENKTENPQ